MSNLLGLEDASKNTAAEPSGPTEDEQDLAVRVSRGANWFYWIGGLSVVNSLIFVFGGNVAFIAGLGVTLIADAIIDASIQQGAPSAFRAVSIVFDLVLVAGLALLGYYAGKRFTVAFLIGIVLYTLDTLVVLVLGDYLMAIFHAWALYSIVRGFIACRQLNNLAASATPPLMPPPPTFT